MIQTTDIINAFFGPSEIVNFRVFDDTKTSSFKGAKLSVEAGRFASVEPELRRHNEQKRGIFFVVNSGGQDDASITKINAQFCEMDDGSFEEQLEKVEAFSLPPSIINRTRKSLHCFWLMKPGAKPERFRDVQKQLVSQFGADPACVNLSRVMRLPGFNHCKAEPLMVECISFHPERRYTQEELSEALPRSSAGKRVNENLTGKDSGLELVSRGCAFISYCRENARTLPEPLWFAMLTNLAPFSGGVKLIHELSAPYPGYSRTETQDKLNRIIREGIRPVNCATLAELGYSCGKMQSGLCPCRSPAGLSYRPADDETLVKLAGELPCSGDTVRDMETIKSFISEYLFNQDNLTAGAIISSEIRKRFSLKSQQLQPFMAFYRECRKEHRESLNRGRALAELTEVPEWYEFNQGGMKFLPGVLAKHLKDSEDVFYAAEQHYIYESGVYSQTTELAAQRIVQSKMIEKESHYAQIADAEKQWRLMILKDVNALNPNPYIINLKNGLYNVLEDTLSPHSPDYLSTVQLPCAFNPEARCPRFMQFLNQAMDGDEGQIGLIQEMLGYTLVPLNSAQKCFVLVGAAGAGKSVLLRVVSEILLGKQNVSNVSWQSLGERFKTAELFGKLANIFADLPTKSIEDTGIFKALVGEDYLTVERKGCHPFAFRSTARLLFSCNAIPKNYSDRSEGFYRRLIIIRFNRSVPEDQRDPDLLQKLTAEVDGIFMFALQGLKRLIDRQFAFSLTDANIEELKSYREESDSVLSFVVENCELGPDRQYGSTDLYNAYKAYCEESGQKPFAQKSFVQQLIADFPGITRGIDTLGKRRMLIGISPGAILY